MKFKGYKDYKDQRDVLLSEAERLLSEGSTEDYQAKYREVEQLDAAFEEHAQNQANIEALRGAVRAPLSLAGAENTLAILDTTTETDMEYRKAFMNHVLKGTPISMNNANEVTTTSDVGAVIPNTILDRIVERMEKVGGIYAEMTKTFFRGGVSVPTSAAKPVATWTTERGKSDTQKKTTGSISFTYHKLRCVVAVSIAVDTVTLEIFEATLAKNVADAMIKAIENAAFNGTGPSNNQPKGILTETVPEGQTIEIPKGSSPTYAKICEAEGALPEEYEEGTKWYMRKKTFFNQFQAMVDSTGQPIAKTNMGTNGKPEYYLLGRKVEFTSYVPAFAGDASEDTPFAVMFNFENYMLNTNLQITISEYEDHDTDDKIKKAIMLVDGKAIDSNGLVVMMIKN